VVGVSLPPFTCTRVAVNVRSEEKRHTLARHGLVTLLLMWAFRCWWRRYPGVTGHFGDEGPEFHGNAFITAVEPWSGHYKVPPVLWMNAHWGQFATPGWKFLSIGPAGGSNLLAAGGSCVPPLHSWSSSKHWRLPLIPSLTIPCDLSLTTTVHVCSWCGFGGLTIDQFWCRYVTLVPPAGSTYPPSTFTLIVETLLGDCGALGKCNVPYQDLGPQDLVFDLKGAIAGSGTAHVWCSSSSAVFVKVGTTQVTAGVLKMTMQPDTICTVTTLTNGTKGAHPIPPPSKPFPTHHEDDFSKCVPTLIFRASHSVQFASCFGVISEESETRFSLFMDVSFAASLALAHCRNII
jgi:hypothetical protein